MSGLDAVGSGSFGAGYSRLKAWAETHSELIGVGRRRAFAARALVGCVV